MISRVFLFILLFQLPAVFAMGGRGGQRAAPALKHFEACKGIPPRSDYHPPVCTRRGLTEDLAKAGYALNDSLALSALIRGAQPAASKLLNESIDAREKMYACVGSSTPDCKARVSAFRAILEKRVVAVRKALLLERISSTEFDPMTVSAADFEIALPAFAGSRLLPTPTVGEEAKGQRLRELLQKAYDSMSVQTENGTDLSHDQTIKYCENHSDPICGKFNEARMAIPDRVHAAGGEVAKRILLEMPMVADFDSVPISDKDLKMSLTKSHKAMLEWRKEILDPSSVGEFLVNYSAYVEPVLKQHPEYCDAAEATYAHTKAVDAVKDASLLAGKGIATLAACIYTGGVGCAAMAVAMGLTDAAGNYLSEQQLVLRMTSLGNVDAKTQQQLKGSDGENGKMIKPVEVENAHRDLIVGLAFDSLALLPVAKEAGVFVSKMKSVGQPVGEEVEAIISEEGASVAKVAGDYAFSNAKESGAQVLSHVGSLRENKDNMADTIYRSLLLEQATP